MNSAGCNGGDDMPRSDVLHRSSSAPVCFTGKPAAVLRLLGVAKPPLPAHLQVAGSTFIQTADAAILPSGHDTGDQPPSVDVLMVDVATAWDKRTLSHSSRALRHPCYKYDECRPYAIGIQAEPFLPAVAACPVGSSNGIWQEAANGSCLNTPAAMAGALGNTTGCDGGRLAGTIGDAVVAVGILTPGQHPPNQHYNRLQEQHHVREMLPYQHQCKYLLLEPRMQPLGRPPSPSARRASTSSLEKYPPSECSQSQGTNLAKLVSSSGSTGALQEQLTACEALLPPFQQAAAYNTSISPIISQEVLSAPQPSSPQQHRHHQQDSLTPQQPHRKSSSSTSSDSERESSESESESGQRDVTATRRRSSNETPATPPPLRRRALSACSSFLDVRVAAAIDVPQAPASDENVPALAAELKAGQGCQSPMPCARCWPAQCDTHLRDPHRQPSSGFLAVETAGITLRLGSGIAQGLALTGPKVVASSQLGFVYRARGQRSVGLTRKRLLA